MSNADACHSSQGIGAALYSESRCLRESRTMPNLMATTMPDVDVESLRRTLDARLPRYAVILHNDDYHSMDYVVEALVKSVPDLTVESAISIMFEAHNTGSAVVIVCVLEQAELYKERIQGYGLGVSIRRE